MRLQKLSKITIGMVAISMLAGLAFAAAGGGPYKLAYKMQKGQRLKYMASRNSESSMEMQGREMASSTEGIRYVNLEVEEIGKDGNITFVYALDSLSWRIKSPQMGDTTFKNPEGVIGKRNRQVISAYGKKLKSAVVDSIKLTGMLAQGGAQLSAFQLLELPNKEIKTGEAWTKSTPDTMAQAAGKFVVTPTINYMAAGETDTLGYKCLRISYTGTTKLKGEGTNMGMNFFVEGDGTVKGTAYFAVKEGLLIATISDEGMEATIALTGQMSMTIPQSSSERVTTVLVK